MKNINEKGLIGNVSFGNANTFNAAGMQVNKDVSFKGETQTSLNASPEAISGRSLVNFKGNIAKDIAYYQANPKRCAFQIQAVDYALKNGASFQGAMAFGKSLSDRLFE